MREITLIRCGTNPRLERLLQTLLAEFSVEVFDAEMPDPEKLHGKLLLFAVAVDALGEDEAFCGLLRTLRATPGCLEGCRAALIFDGATEFDTKDLARKLMLAANNAGCAFPGKPLVEATGSLQNLAVLQKKHGLPDLEATYRFAASALLERLTEPEQSRKNRPRLLILHASDHATSNTLALGELTAKRLDDAIKIETISLRNGTIHDCRGCSYTVCSHFAAQGGCFYGGSIVEEVLPAVLRCDALLLLCPNYNDAVGANIMAFINRLTGLTVSNSLYGKALFAIVVSGYSGGDIVAQQLLGALCLNKAFSLPSRFCLLETANDPGQALSIPGILDRIDRFAAQIRAELLEA